MIDRGFILVWCGVVCTIILISAGFGLFLIAKNGNMTCIKNRQPKAQSLGILTTATEAMAWNLILFINEENLVGFKICFHLMIATSVLNYINWAIFFHRIWMLFYKSLLQKSLTGFNIFHVETRRRASSLSNFWVRQKYRVVDSMYMLLVEFIFWCPLCVLLTYLALTCGMQCIAADYYPSYDWLNDFVAGSLVIFGLSMLAMQKIFTVTDSFSISIELFWKCLVLASFFPFYGLLLHTEIITSVNPLDKIIYALLVIISMLLIQLLITDYYIWELISRVKKLHKTIDIATDMDKLLINQKLFKQFEKQLQQEFRIENLNFLVSCIRYRNMFIEEDLNESSLSETPYLENPQPLWWKESMKPEKLAMSEGNRLKMALTIFGEYFGPRAPQKVNLSEQTVTKLSNKIKSFSSINNREKRDIFCGAYNYICDLLSKDALKKFKKDITLLRVESQWDIQPLMSFESTT